MRMPNGALASLAGNAGPEHDVAVADLILVQDRSCHRRTAHATFARYKARRAAEREYVPA